MQSTRIADLLAPFLGDAPQLSPDDLDRISIYVDILLRWNARINLTAIRDPDQIVTRHFGESLFAARHLFPHRNVSTVAAGGPVEQSLPAGHAGDSSREGGGRGERAALEARGGRAVLQGRVKAGDQNGALAPAVTLADVGSGAGFPGIPIKLWASEVHLTLIESNHKKATFLREVSRVLTLTNVDIRTSRAEAVTDQTFDVVTLRAVERFESILPTATNLTASRGRLALLITANQLALAKSSLAQLAKENPTWLNPAWQVEPIPLSKNRTLSIVHHSSQ